ncbi:type IV secretory system conjugative DNA transfer family protein [Magnetospirillum fulvum]|nr:type IV secretion system DNA-binding domain-containing protein [Magnetospirillum fulvum]
MCGTSAGSELFFDRFWTLPISEESRKRHTYITGGAGSGKSEALKAIMFHYIARNSAPALVLIDPHGDVAEQVARWPELADGKRLVYIDPALSPGKTPVFNPLDIPDAERNPDDIAIVVKQLIEVFPELIDGLEFTAQMRTMIGACLTVLLHVPGSTLADLMEFMDDTKNARWLGIAGEVLAGSLYHDFFRREFTDKTMDISKRGVRMRLYEALQGNPAFFRMIAGKSSFSLEELLNRRAVVIFRLGRGDIGETTSNLIGKFIMARLKAFAFKQGRLPEADRIPVHVFVDECQNYLSESVEIILKEARKYGVHLTLAQQILGDGMSPDLLKAILGNTAVKITGKNALHTLKKIADETGADLDELQALSTGFFHIKAGSRKGIVVRMPSHRVKDKGAIKPEAWERLRDSQVVRYYRAPTSHRTAAAGASYQPLPVD